MNMERIDPLIAESHIDGQYAVTIIKRPHKYEVKYGAHIRPCHSLTEALAEFSDCVLHAAQCARRA